MYGPIHTKGRWERKQKWSKNKWQTSTKILAFAFARCEWALMGEQTVYSVTVEKISTGVTYRNRILICVHHHGWAVDHLAWQVLYNLGMYRNGPSVYICTREVLEYCANQNTTPVTEPISSVQAILEKRELAFDCKLNWHVTPVLVEHEFTLSWRRKYKCLTPPPPTQFVKNWRCAWIVGSLRFSHFWVFVLLHPLITSHNRFIFFRHEA